MNKRWLTTPDTVLNVCGSVGVLLLESGAETFRIEDTVERIGKSVDLPVICYSTMTSIFISVQHTSQTLLVKTKFGQYDLQRVDDINQLSRQLANHMISFSKFTSQIKQLKHKTHTFPYGLRILGAGLVSVPPMFINQLNLYDMLIGFFIGICAFIVSQCLPKLTSLSYMGDIAGGWVVGMLAMLSVQYHLSTHTYMLIVSGIMPLVPGVALTNAIREIIAKEILSGLVRLTNALLVSGAISFGILLAVELIAT